MILSLFFTLFISSAFARPILTAKGIVLTDEDADVIYFMSGASLSEIFRAPGCGMYLSISPSGRYIGFKYIDGDGMQIPSVFDLEKMRCYELLSPQPLAGQVSFNLNEEPSFTAGNFLQILSEKRNFTFDIGYYSNLCPVSPDGKKVIFNDSEDVLWLFYLRDSKKLQISPPGVPCCYPVWSLNGKRILFSGISGQIFVCDSSGGGVTFVDNGINPAISPDGENIVYERRNIEGMELINTDLFFWNHQKQNLERLTFTPDDNEMYPFFAEDGKLVYLLPEKNEIRIALLQEGSLIEESRILISDFSSEKESSLFAISAKGDSLDVPYIHQVYDTPDWFNGHWACAPSTALMAISYYGLLPQWNCQCSYPYSHISPFGNYICERYMFNESDYNLWANDPAGTPAQGGYGYMWTGSYSPYSRMVSNFSNHGLLSSRDDTPTFSETVDEINAGYPYSMCVGLTTSGHLVLGVGQVQNWHTLIFNDPYGDKNTTGYPSYDGKFVRYDWPGYNNGYANLNQVYWCVTSRGEFPDLSDTVVDDRHLTSGFYLNSEHPSSMRFWRDALSGYENHSWWTYTTQGSSDTCYAKWTPRLDNAGLYSVSAFIPADNSTAASAIYRVHHSSGTDSVFVDQSIFAGEWVQLGVFMFDTAGAFVYLGDMTGIQGQKIAFDAVRFSVLSMNSEEQPRETSSLVYLRFEGADLICALPDVGVKNVLFRLYDTAGRLVFSAVSDADDYGIFRLKTGEIHRGQYFLIAGQGIKTGAFKVFKLN